MVGTLMSSILAALVVLPPTASSVERIACRSISANVGPGIPTPCGARNVAGMSASVMLEP
jgi:hypothetical protein